MCYNISPHLTYKEVVKSHTAIRKGIVNAPNKHQLENIRAWANAIFEPTRNHFEVPIGVSSVFRCKKLNAIIGGAPTSQHTAEGDCAAGDLDADIYGHITNREIFDFIRENLEFDQLIWEFGTDNEPDWVHVSFCRNGKNRKEILRSIKVNGKVIYQKMS